MMDEQTLYAHILNLSAPWQVQSLSLDETSGSVTVIVGIAEHTQLTCPTCGQSCSIHDHRRRRWRHLDTPPFQGCVGLTCLKRLYEGVAGSPVAPFSLCALHGRTPVGESPALSWSLRKK